MNDQAHELREGALPIDYAVDLGNNRLGRVYAGNGATFSLANIFGESEIGGERFSEVYIYTKDNKYKLEEDSEDLAGLLTDSSASRKAGGRLQTTLLDRKTLAEKRVVVGKPFDSGAGNTSEVTQIIAVAGRRIYEQRALEQLTQGRKSTVITDFKTACLPIGAEH